MGKGLEPRLDNPYSSGTLLKTSELSLKVLTLYKKLYTFRILHYLISRFSLHKFIVFVVTIT
jgi:hypothetical protein